MKNSQVSNFQLQYLQRQIDELRNELSDSQSVPDGTVSFFYRGSCPTGWAEITGLDGHYLRIKASTETLGQVKEQMVHKHKHVSPIIAQEMTNNARYGPYAPTYESIVGDGDYLARPSTVPSDLYFPYPDTAGWGAGTWFNYTSDGMNREETIRRATFHSTTYTVKTCPNRDEGDSICKSDGTNLYSVPYLSEMPLVGNENRPNSISLIACVSGYSRCTLKSGSLSCSN